MAPITGRGSKPMKLALAPVPYYWPREDLLAFYEDMAQTPIDIIYLGETVCSKRRTLNTNEWIALAEQLHDTGKEIVISTLCLLEAESELKTLRRLCDNGRFMIEANDMAAVHLLAGNTAFVTGPTVNIYNPQTLAFLSRLGMKRWVLPVELGHDALVEMQANKPPDIETEVLAFGRMPLAISARCFTARHHNRSKDDCQLTCIDYPDGLLLNTQEDQPFVTINGVQLQSAAPYSLLDDVATLKELNVDVLRLIPQRNHMAQIIRLFSDRINAPQTVDEDRQTLETLTGIKTCNGYWRQQAGIK